MNKRFIENDPLFGNLADFFRLPNRSTLWAKKASSTKRGGIDGPPDYSREKLKDRLERLAYERSLHELELEQAGVLDQTSLPQGSTRQSVLEAMNYLHMRGIITDGTYDDCVEDPLGAGTDKAAEYKSTLRGQGYHIVR